MIDKSYYKFIKKRYYQLKLMRTCVDEDLTKFGFQCCNIVPLFKLYVIPWAPEDNGPFTTCRTPP